MSGSSWHWKFGARNILGPICVLLIVMKIQTKLWLGAAFLLAVSSAHAKPKPALLSSTGAVYEARVSTRAKSKSWVQLSAETDSVQYITGAPIQVVLAAKNTHSSAAFLHFTSGQRFELQLFKVGGNNPVYTWSASRMFAMMTGQLKLLPNQTQTFTAEIGDEQGALVPGRYELRAHLTNSSQIMAQPIQIEIVASPVQLRATLDKTELKAGEPLNIKISAMNTTKEAQTLRFGSGQSFDVFIINEEGQQIWNWGANKRFTMALRLRRVATGRIQIIRRDMERRSVARFQTFARNGFGSSSSDDGSARLRGADSD